MILCLGGTFGQKASLILKYCALMFHELCSACAQLRKPQVFLRVDKFVRFDCDMEARHAKLIMNLIKLAFPTTYKTMNIVLAFS